MSGTGIGGLVYRGWFVGVYGNAAGDSGYNANTEGVMRGLIIIMAVVLCTAVITVGAEACEPCEGGYYNDWSGQIYLDADECNQASTVVVWGSGGTAVPMSRRDFVMSTTIFGVLISGLMVYGLIRAIT